MDPGSISQLDKFSHARLAHYVYSLLKPICSFWGLTCIERIFASKKQPTRCLPQMYKCLTFVNTVLTSQILPTVGKRSLYLYY